jgi:hypothetical protein
MCSFIYIIRWVATIAVEEMETYDSQIEHWFFVFFCFIISSDHVHGNNVSLGTDNDK